MLTSLLPVYFLVSISLPVTMSQWDSRPSRSDEKGGKPKLRGKPMLAKGSIKPGTFKDMEHGPAAFCPKGHYVTGFKQSSEQHEYRGDDSAMNALRFICGDKSEIKSLEGAWTNTRFTSWGPQQFCPDGRLAVGIEIRMESEHPTDVTGVNNVRLHCNREDPNDVVEGLKARSWGEWKGNSDCEEKHHICGIETSVQKDQGRCEGCDDIALTGVQVYCCEDDKDDGDDGDDGDCCED